MKKIIALLAFSWMLVLDGFGQGTLTGTITDEKGEPLIGVTVVIKSENPIGAVTDFDGNYSITIKDSAFYNIFVSYIGYQSINDSIQLFNNETVVKDFKIEESSTELDVVEITAKASKEKEYYMENVKKNSSSSIDFINIETIKKTGDANVTAAVARVSGVSTNGGFITVRGMGDRYVRTTLNGSQIPTLDPFTNNIKLDIIPSSLIDNLIITKTYSPDLPGDWAGAYLSVETKDYPERFTVSIETSLGYNNNTTFKNVLASEKSSTDWLGYDNNFREYDHNSFTEVVTPNQYQELAALGLNDYYKSIGVTEETPWNNTYYKLGLVELGLLQKADFENPQAFTEAKKKYEQGNYSEDAYAIINENAAKSGKAFKNNWSTFYKKAPMNFSQSFSIGTQTKLFGKPLGIIAGFKYGNTVQYDANSVAIRTDRTDYNNITGEPFFTNKIDQQIAKYSNGWSSIINVAYKYHPNHSFSYFFMPNFLGVNSLRDGFDSVTIAQTTTYSNQFYKSQYYEERKQLVHQFKSEHFIPRAKLKLQLDGSYTKGESSAPDFKNLTYFEDPQNAGAYVFDLTVSDIRRNYRYLNEEMLDLRWFGEFPLWQKENLPRKLKFGSSYLQLERNFSQFDYRLNLIGTSLNIDDNDLSKYFDSERFGINSQSGKIDYYFTSDGNPGNKTIGQSKITSAFVMTDFTIVPRVRVSGGVRMEHTNIFSDAYLFYNLNYAKDDPRRLTNEFVVNPTYLKQYNFLPSATFIYKIQKQEEKPFNLRLSYSKTLARPSLREYSKSLIFDFELNSFVIGNDSLKVAQIHNYDLRLEKFFKSGDNISFSIFYKDLKNHIELINPGFPGYTWINIDTSSVKGIEVDFKKKISKSFEFRANMTLVKSEERFKTGTYYVVREMFGQAPYVVNGMISYKNDSIRLTTTVSYNIQGPKLVLAGGNFSAPNVYELPRHSLDLKVSKELGKHFAINVTIRNILNYTIRRAYKLDGEFKLDYDTYRYGTDYQLSVTYKI